MWPSQVHLLSWWESYSRLNHHQASFWAEEPTSESLPPTSRVVSIPEEEYNCLIPMDSNSVVSSSRTTFASAIKVWQMAQPLKFGFGHDQNQS